VARKAAVRFREISVDLTMQIRAGKSPNRTSTLLLISLPNIAITQILLSMRYLGIQKFKHFVEPGIIPYSTTKATHDNESDTHYFGLKTM
jgi:hypothetical protein